MAATPTPRTTAEHDPRLNDAVDQLLAHPNLKAQPIAQALYPTLDPVSATAKFRNKRTGADKRSFSPEERQALHRILLEQLRPLQQAYSLLQSLPVHAQPHPARS